jgi:hypothetical protein
MTSRPGFRRKWFPALLVFAAGLPLGWLLRGGDLHKEDPAFSSAAKPVARHAVTAKRGTDDRWDVFAQQMKNAAGPDWMPMWNDLQPSDRAAAMESMVNLTGQLRKEPERHLAKTMGEILKEWAGDDLEGAISAARNTSNEDLREFMVRGIKEYLIGKDLDRLITLEKEFPQRLMRFDMSLVQRGVMATLEKGAEEYVDALEKAPDSGGIGTAGKFAADFDFQYAADGLARLMESRKDVRLLACPANFLQEWAKQDPDAAFSWWVANERLPFSGLRDLILTQESESPGDAAAWLAAKIQQPAVNREKILREMGRENPEVLPTRINAIARAMPDRATGDAFLIDFLRYNTGPDLDRVFPDVFSGCPPCGVPGDPGKRRSPAGRSVHGGADGLVGHQS